MFTLDVDSCWSKHERKAFALVGNLHLSGLGSILTKHDNLPQRCNVILSQPCINSHLQSFDDLEIYDVYKVLHSRLKIRPQNMLTIVGSTTNMIGGDLLTT